ncbi:MAG: Wzz/FepE/Etk N-terminal domain-containing protein [Pseudomonadota bacterium]
MNAVHGQGGPDAELDFGRLLRAILDAWVWITAVVVITAVVTYVGVSLIAPKYRAETKILIESQDTALTGSPRGQEEQRAVLDQQGVISQVQLLESVDLARSVIRSKNLAALSEFNPSVGSLLPSLSDITALFSVAEDTGEGANESTAANEQAIRAQGVSDKVLERYFKRLEVYQIEDSRVIVVRFWSTDPDLAAEIANAIVAEYSKIQADAKRTSTKSTIAFLEPEIQTLQNQARAAQRRVVEFRAGADLLLGADNQTLTQQQLSELNSQLSAARARKSDAEAKAGLILELLRSGSALETASDVLGSAFIQRLRERQVALRARIAELSTTLLPNHPEIKGLRSQLADLEEQISSEARKIVRGFESEARLAEARVQALRNNLDELKSQVARANEQEVRLNELEREAAVTTARLEERLVQYRAANARKTAAVIPVDARPISSATPPSKSFAPKKKAITAGVTLAALLLCLGFVVMREFIRGSAFIYAEEAVPEAPTSAALGPYPDAAALASALQAAYGSPAVAPTPAATEPARAPETADTSESDGGGDRRRRARRGDDGPRLAEDIAEPQVVAQTEVAAEPKAEIQAEPEPAAQREPEVVTPTAQPAVQPVRGAGRAARRSGIKAAASHLIRPYAECYDWLEANDLGCVMVSARKDADLAVDTALELARETTDDGQSCIVILLDGDADAIEASGEPDTAIGFAELLDGEAGFSDVIYQDVASRAHIIPPGRNPFAVGDIDAAEFGFLVDALAQTYDRVVISMGTLGADLGTADLLKAADSIVLGVDWGQDEAWGIAAFETLTAHGFGHVFVTMAPIFAPDEDLEDAA